MIISARAKVAGVFGWPVEHSRSPRLHGYWLDAYGIDGAYVPLPVRPEHFEQALRLLPAMGFAGANVTLPHKEAALKTVDESSALARRVGAVNTVVVRDDGSLYGDNTDAEGFVANLREGAPGWDASTGPAVMLGAGGVARAAGVALLDAGAPELRIVNRTASRAEKLAQELGRRAKVSLWVDRAHVLADAALLVNATLLGMDGQAPLDIELGLLAKNAVVTDTVYTPLETPLLRKAAERGNVTVDGIGMLLHQGRRGFAAWYGVDPEVTAELRAFVLDG